MEKSETFYQQKKMHVFVTQTFSNLIQLKREEKKEEFNALVLKILSSIKKYINGRLDAAVKKGHFSKNKYHADEFIDQLFIEVYDHINKVKTANEFYLWLFKKADQLLEDTIVEEEFDDLFFENIDNYFKPEWDVMEEGFSAYGYLLMVEELDDNSYDKNDYTLNHVFIEDDEQGYIDKLDEIHKDLFEDLEDDIIDHKKLLSKIEKGEKGLSDGDYRNKHHKIMQRMETFTNDINSFKKIVFAYVKHL